MNTKYTVEEIKTIIVEANELFDKLNFKKVVYEDSNCKSCIGCTLCNELKEQVIINRDRYSLCFFLNFMFTKMPMRYLDNRPIDEYIRVFKIIKNEVSNLI